MIRPSVGPRIVATLPVLLGAVHGLPVVLRRMTMHLRLLMAPKDAMARTGVMQLITDSRLEEYLFERNALDRLTRIDVTDDEEIGYVRFDRVWMTAPFFFPVTADGHAFLHFFGMFAPSKYASLYAAELRETIVRHATTFEAADCTTGAFVLGGAPCLLSLADRLRAAAASGRG